MKEISTKSMKNPSARMITMEKIRSPISPGQLGQKCLDDRIAAG